MDVIDISNRCKRALVYVILPLNTLTASFALGKCQKVYRFNITKLNYRAILHLIIDVFINDMTIFEANGENPMNV